MRIILLAHVSVIYCPGGFIEGALNRIVGDEMAGSGAQDRLEGAQEQVFHVSQPRSVNGTCRLGKHGKNEDMEVSCMEDANGQSVVEALLEVLLQRNAMAS